MTITLHWWIVPALIVVASVVVAWVTNDEDASINIGPPLAVLVGILFAIAMVIGHFL